jgi:hypothetical protein
MRTCRRFFSQRSAETPVCSKEENLTALHLASLALVSVAVLRASPPKPIIAEFVKMKEGLGPVDFVVQVSFPSKSIERISISVSGTNNSGVHLRHVAFCVHLEGGACSATFWTESSWRSGTSRKWSISVNGRKVGLSATKSTEIKASEIGVTIRELEKDRFADVQKVFVEKLDGDFGNVSDLVREQVMAAVVNSGRFQLVDDKSQADAVIRGRAEQRERGTEIRSKGREHSSNRTSGIAGGIGTGTTGNRSAVATGIVLGSRKSNGDADSETKSLTEVLFSDHVILRLTTVAGESIWVGRHIAL